MQVREEDFVSRLFVASTHAPVLFFSSRGKVYKEKVWRLPIAAPQARGKALINILPLEQAETITTIMPLPEDEATWANLDVMFATTSGTVRRNKLSDFVDVRPSGIIAMKLEDGDVDRRRADLHREGRRAAHRQRRPVHPLRGAGGARVPGPHVAIGVRGITLADKDRRSSRMSILSHVEVTAEERAAYHKRASAVRRGVGDEEAGRRPRPKPRKRSARSNSARSVTSNCRRPSNSC